MYHLLLILCLVPVVSADLYYITFNDTCNTIKLSDDNSVINLYNVTGTVYVWLNQLFNISLNNCSYYIGVKQDDNVLFIYSTVVLAVLLICSTVCSVLTCLYAVLQYKSKATRKLYRTII